MDIFITVFAGIVTELDGTSLVMINWLKLAFKLQTETHKRASGAFFIGG